MAKNTRPDGVVIERLGPLYWPLYVSLLAVTAIGTLCSGVAMATTHDAHHEQDHGSHGHAALWADADCSVTKRTYAVTVTAAGFSQQHITASLCDVIRVHNESSEQAKVAIGPHDQHLKYPGYDEPVLRPGDATSIVLRTAGDFDMHDHFNDAHTAEIDISK